MNECLDHECVNVCFSVRALSLFPLRFCRNKRISAKLYFCGSVCVLFSILAQSSQPLSLFLRRLKSFADRHSQLCSSRSIQNPSTFLAKSFIAGRTERSEDEVVEEEKRGLRGGERREVPPRRERGMGWESRVCSSPAPNWYKRERVDRGGWRVGERRERGGRCC